jgi:hypothetical protein
MNHYLRVSPLKELTSRRKDKAAGISMSAKNQLVFGIVEWHIPVLVTDTIGNA